MTWNLKGTFNKQSIRTASSISYAAWTGDPEMMPSTLAPAAGVIYFIRAYVDNPVTCSHMYTWIKTAGSGLSGCYFGVYQATSGGTRLAVSADLSSSLTTTGLATLSISSLSGLTYNEEIWLAFLCSSGTPPILPATRQFGSNIGMSSDYRVWKSTSGSQTTLPSTAPAMSAPALGYQFLALGA